MVECPMLDCDSCPTYSHSPAAQAKKRAARERAVKALAINNKTAENTTNND